jgi:hypothetical protein
MPDPPGVARTQARHVVRLGRFFGISTDLNERFREKTASILDIPAQKIIDSAARIRDGPFTKLMASEVKGFLQSYAAPLTKPKNLLKQGAHAGFWGIPLILT